MSTLSDTTVLRQSEAVFATEVDGETVLMSVSANRYFGLDAIGSAIWAELAQPITVDALCAAMVAAYEGDPAQIHQDVRALLTQLVAHGLVEAVA
ncbi:MAG: PqqD family protein [Alphaproteobacteria bacterium]|nr:PqqD family peptide modification chaperone [Alphaproteobacteria bacterium]TAD87571.1 MAG: PqqD family protein [Alphaproteobacteria bacterium]